MATSKTGSFWLTEVVSLDTINTVVQGTIDLGAYVDVGDQQALAVEQVDMIVQAYDTANDNYSNSLSGLFAGGAGVGMQLTDLNPGAAFVRADDNTLIGSGVVYWDDGNSIASVGPDLFPDTFGKLSESRMVVNDNLYVSGAFHGAALEADRECIVTVRIKARIVKLSTKDWIAIAVQSTAADN